MPYAGQTPAPDPDCLEERERRTICRALTFWHGLSGEGGTPSWSALPSRFPDNLAPYLYLARLDRSGTPILLRCGSALAELCAAAPTGKAMDEVLPLSLRDVMVGYLHAVVNHCQPLADSGLFTLENGTEFLYRNIVMPLADGPDRIEGVLGAFNCRRLS